MRDATMAEIVIGLTAFGVPCFAVIEILEKCEQRDADAEQGTLRHPHVAP
jgi:hypothetical protein